MAGTFSASDQSTIVGTTVRPVGGVMAIASRTCYLLKASIFNMGATAGTYRLARVTAAGTPGATITAAAHHSSDGDAADMTAKTGWTADGTITAHAFEIAPLGAAVGHGYIFTFAWPGLFIPAGTANGIAWVAITAAGTAPAWSFTWHE
jgi:hypothetical protein